MKTKSLLKNVWWTLCSLVLCVAIVSCEKDEPEPRKKVSLQVSPDKVEVTVGSTANVTLKSGTAPYTVKSGDDKVATAKVDKNILTITGVKAGTTIVTVTDKNKMMGRVSVTVKAAASALDFDKKTVTVSVGKAETVIAKGGTAPYTVTSKDTKIATATVNGDKINIKGVKAGSTTLTVTDKNKKSGMVNVTVK